MPPVGVQLVAFDVAGRPRLEATAWALGGGAGVTGHRVRRERDEFGRLVRVDSDVAPLGSLGGGGLDPDSWVPNPLQGQAREFSYDDAQRLATQDVFHAGQGSPDAHFVYAYDAASRLLSRTDPVRGVQQTYSYRADGLPWQVVHGDLSDLPGGAPPGWPFAERWAYTLSYDARNWLSGMVHTLHDTTGPPPASPLRHDYSFVHDDARRLVEARLVRSGGHVLGSENVYWRSYAFDPTDDWNLSSVVDLVSGTTTSYGYDSLGQDLLLEMTVDDGGGSPKTTFFEYNDTGALVAEGPAGELGNMPGSVESPSRSYTWSWDDRLWQVADLTSGLTTQYAYDPGGRLLAQRTAALGADRVRLWDGWGRLGHLADGGSLRDESYTPE